jgi:hypothetical protein
MNRVMRWHDLGSSARSKPRRLVGPKQVACDKAMGPNRGQPFGLWPKPPLALLPGLRIGSTIRCALRRASNGLGQQRTRDSSC